VRAEYSLRMPLFGKPGERIAYERYQPLGPSNSPPLVLLHGFTVSSAAFDANIAALRRHFTVVTVDLLGHGASESPEEPEPYAPEAAIARLLALFDELGFDKLLLCGHSLGGALALRLALDAPERLSGLVVMNSMSAAGTPEWRDQARAGMSQMAAKARKEGTGFLKETRLYPAHSKRLDDPSRLLLVQAFEQLTPAGMAGTAEQLTANVNVWERHPELAVPLLVIVGDRDRDFAAQARAFVSRFPSELVRTAVIPGAGHAANIEEPRAFEDAMVAFGREIGVLSEGESVVEASLLSRLGGTALTAVGVLLVASGIALVGASFVVGGKSAPAQQPVLAAQPADSVTREIVTAVAGTRAAGPNAPLAVVTITAPPETATVLAAAVTSAPVATEAPAATSAPAAPTPASAPADTPVATPATTPSPAPTADATPAPTAQGPYAAVGGPVTAAVNEVVTFVSMSVPGADVLRWSWSTSGVVAPQPNIAVLRVRFPNAGCQTVGLTVVFKGGAQKSATMTVAVGGAICQ
jgi:2-succinyl-6-hydroxy-2,4-cyclohexadiene-1-carboxylate synthase